MHAFPFDPGYATYDEGCRAAYEPYRRKRETPLQLRGKHVARNVLFNWFGTAVSMGVGFFLSPFILHRLGDLAYGVWLMAVSAVGYLSLLDLGMQSSVLRFVSKGHAQQDHEGASNAISAALWVRLQISVVAVVLSAGIAAIFPLLFKVPPDMIRTARMAVVLIGLTTAVTMSLGVFGSVLSALNRYDLQNMTTFVQTIVRVVGVIAVLLTHHGIVAIAVCELAAVLISKLLQVWTARRLYPQLQMRLRQPDKEVLRSLWSYSSYVFLTAVAVQLVYQTDTLVVGHFISTVAVTFYGIAISLCRYATQIVRSMSATFTPAASTYEASGDTAGLLSLFENGTRATFAVSLPLILTFIVRGPTFIGLWMGPKYAHDSGWVLIILSVGLLFAFVNEPAASIAFGIGKHKAVAYWAIIEGVANLTLSIILVHFFGIFGVAFGTLLPSLVVQLGFWPGYIKQVAGVSRSEVLLRIWLPMLLCGIPFGLASFWVDRHFAAPSKLVFFVQVLLTLPVFAATLFIVMRKQALAVFQKFRHKPAAHPVAAALPEEPI